MKGGNRYGCRWPDASETGAITDSFRLAAAYAKETGVPGLTGTVIDYDASVMPKRERDEDEEDTGEEARS